MESHKEQSQERRDGAAKPPYSVHSTGYSVSSAHAGQVRGDLTGSDARPSLVRGVAQAVVLAAIMFSSLGLYLIILKWRGPAGSDLITYLPWDEVVPFRPAWVWAYLLPYLFGPALVGMLSPQTFKWFVQRGLVIVFLTLTLFIILPTQTAPRPPSNSEDGPTARLYQFMIEADEPPANAAPSLHVSLTFLLAVVLIRDFPRWWPATCAATPIVWLSTLFTRQHHLIDVATGALLASAVVIFWPKRASRGA